MTDLYRPRFLPDLLIAALDRNGDRPCLLIDGDVITAAQMRDRISQYLQAFGDQGIVQGQGVATLSKNRPEVLCSMGAVMVAGCHDRSHGAQHLGPVLRQGGYALTLHDALIAKRLQILTDPIAHLSRGDHVTIDQEARSIAVSI